MPTSPLTTKLFPSIPITGRNSLEVRARLDQHLRQWLGVWPPDGIASTTTSASARLVVSEERLRPGWDGRVRPVQGVTGPEGTVLSVSPRFGNIFAGVDIEALVGDLFSEDAPRLLTRRLGMPVSAGMAVFRWSESVPEMEEIGECVDAGDPRLPEWLRPFNGGIVAAFDGDEYMAGVGLKRHDDFAREVSVGTDSDYRGQGLATLLVAQAARWVIAEGGVPIYQHGEDNVGSAKVAEAAGFPDRGWHSIGIYPQLPDAHRG